MSRKQTKTQYFDVPVGATIDQIRRMIDKALDFRQVRFALCNTSGLVRPSAEQIRTMTKTWALSYIVENLHIVAGGSFFLTIPAGETTTEPVKAAETAETTAQSPAIVDSLAALLEALKTSGSVANREEIEDIARIEARKLIEKLERPTVIEVKIPDTNTTKPVGVVHHKTETLIKILATRSAGICPNVLLVGPAGSGKTRGAEKVADALSMQFYPYSVGPQTTKTDLLGYMNATGVYVTTVVRQAFENGGVLLLDEFDAANPGVVTILNALLENGYCSFPDAVVKKHADFVCICSANTYGLGADTEYVGRNKLDAATLDRFIVIDWPYDNALESALCSDKVWLDKVRRYRARAESLKMRVVISPRASIKGAALLAAGLSLEEVEKALIFKGLSAEQVAKIKG